MTSLKCNISLGLSFLVAAWAPLFGQIVPQSMGGDLRDSHGNQFVRGRQGTLHLVFAKSNGELVYRRGSETWGNPFSFVVNSSADYKVWPMTQAMFPCVDEDGEGNLGIAVIDASSGSEWGRLLYRFRNTIWNTGWDEVEIAPNATRPTLAIHRGVAHLAWEDSQGQIQYATFAADHNPPDIHYEVAFKNGCPFSGFTMPSLTLLRDKCDPDIVQIGALFWSNEAPTTQSTCGFSSTQVGAVVKQRANSSQTWFMIYKDLQIGSAYDLDYAAISLSLSAKYDSGPSYLAYADRLDQQGRTRIAILEQGQSQKVDLHTQKALPVHIIANHLGTSGEFRVAWQGDEQGQVATAYRTGRWLFPQTTPSWIEPFPMAIGSGIYAKRPQCIFWNRCNTQAANIHYVYEERSSPNVSELRYDYVSDPECAPVVLGLIKYCRDTEFGKADVLPILIHEFETGMSVDVSRFGMVVASSSRSVEVFDGRYRHVFSWDEGELETLWDSGFLLTGTVTLEVESEPDAWPIQRINEDVAQPGDAEQHLQP